MRTTLSIALGLTLMMASASRADLVYNTSADLTGTRGVANLVLGGEFDGPSPSVSWTISEIGGGQWHYEYRLAGFDLRGSAILHVILDLADDAVSPLDPGLVTGLSTSGTLSGTEYGTFDGVTDASNPGFPAGASITGVRITVGGTGTLTIGFDSNRAPAWGDLYLKGTSSSFAYNAGLTQHLTSENVMDFIARPFSASAVPEPASLSCAAMGLGIMSLARRVRRRADTTRS